MLQNLYVSVHVFLHTHTHCMHVDICVCAYCTHVLHDMHIHKYYIVCTTSYHSVMHIICTYKYIKCTMHILKPI